MNRLEDAIADLRSAWGVVHKQWGATREVWRDGIRAEFEVRFWNELRASATRTIAAAEELVKLFDSALAETWAGLKGSEGASSRMPPLLGYSTILPPLARHSFLPRFDLFERRTWSGLNFCSSPFGFCGGNLNPMNTSPFSLVSSFPALGTPPGSAPSFLSTPIVRLSSPALSPPLGFGTPPVFGVNTGAYPGPLGFGTPPVFNIGLRSGR